MTADILAQLCKKALRFLAAAIVTFSVASGRIQSSAVTPEQVLDKYRIASGGGAWDGKSTERVNFSIRAFGMRGAGVAVLDLRNGQRRVEYTLGPMKLAEGYDGANVWEKDKSGTVRLQQGAEDKQLAANEAYRVAAGWWKPDRGGADIAIAREETLGSRPHKVLSIKPVGGKAFEAWFDEQTSLLFRTVERQGPETVTTTFSDYRKTDDVLLPCTAIIDRGHGEKYLETRAVSAVEFTGPLAADSYIPPKEEVADFSLGGNSRNTELPFQLINNHIFAPVRVNGKGPYMFLFDTGAGSVISKALAKKLGLAVQGSIPSFGSGPGIMDGRLTRITEFRIGNATLHDKVFSVLPLRQIEPAEGTPMLGLVGYEVFRRFVIRVDYATNQIVLIDPHAFDAAESGTPVRFVFHDHIPEVQGSFEGIPARFNLDVGARFELSLTASFVRNNTLESKSRRGAEAVFGWGIGGAIHGFVTRGADVSVGSVHISNVVTNFSSEDRGGFSGSIGNGLLKRFILTFDYNHQIIYFKPRSDVVEDSG